MNSPHQNARTTRLGRAEMIRRVIEDGQPVREVARGFGISERTARKWQARFKAEGPDGLENRSSRPRSIANRTAGYWIGVMEMLRREYRLTAEEIAGKPALARSPVAAWLTRRGLGRLTALEPKQPPRRYQRQHPGELLHLDIKKLPRFERVMTDNGSGYVARLFGKALRLLRIRHIRTRPYTPKTNGKAERFIQTLLREWAYAIPFNSSEARVTDLPRWLTWYNQQRPHGSLGRRTPAQALAGTT